MPQIKSLCHNKSTLGLLGIQGSLIQYTQNCIQMSNMIISSLAIDQNVVKEDHNKPAELTVEHPIHSRLKSSKSIRQAKRDDQKLKMSTVILECCLLYILLSNPNLMIAGPQINLRKILCPMQFINELTICGIRYQFLMVLLFSIR